MLCALCLLGLTSCSTKKNNFFTRSYHNLTSYYNIYWNGKEALKKAEIVLKEDVADNYNDVLPILKVGEDKDTSATSAQTNRVIEKAAKAIKKHSITVRGVEYVKYIDDAYMLMAKGYFFQRQFSQSRMVLNVVMSDFSKNPEYLEAMMWATRTYVQEGEHEMAFGFLSKVNQQSSALKKEPKRLLPQVQAEYYLSQEDYDQAMPYIKESLTIIKDRDQKARIYFILGQIAQKKGKLTEAYDYYKKCLKMNPPLAMSFNASFNRALCYDPKSVSSKDIIKALQKLLKDPKNSIYFGRIYYVLGEIAFADKAEALAIDYMNQAIEASAEDPDRLLLAAKKLAEYFYDKADYIQAEKYYSMSAKIIKAEDEDYYTITSRSKYLAELVLYYTALNQADTSKMLGEMNNAGRQDYGKKKAEEYKKQVEAERIKALGKSSSSSSVPTGSNSSWYFYNSQTRGAGYNEFIRKWGRRKSEDLWCFATKPPMASLKAMQQEMSEVLEEEEKEEEKELTPENPEYYLQNIPQTDLEVKIIDSIIENGLFNIALVYFDKLGENKEGERYFLRLINEYPKSDYVPSAYENLCKIYHERGNTALYKKYADLLAKEYSGTEQDKRINDPDYYKKLAESEKSVTALYEQAYNLFSDEDYGRMMATISQIEEKYPVNIFIPQLTFLKAVGLAHTSGYDEMIVLLENFKNSYPDHELTEKTEVLLERAKREVKNRPKPEYQQPEQAQAEAISTTPVAVDKPKVKVVFAKKKNIAEHKVVFICNKTKINSEITKVRIGDFNRKFYEEQNIKIDVEDFGENSTMFVISGFKNQSKAAEYNKQFKINEYVFSAVKPEDGYLFIISDENIELLRKSQDVEGYMIYFKANY